MGKYYSCFIVGCEPHVMELELQTVQGLPKLCLVGVSGRSIQDSRERVLTALKNCGYKSIARRCVVNFFPQFKLKREIHFELALAVALLVEQKFIPFFTQKTLIIGQLGLNGSIRSVSHVFAATQQAQRHAFTRVIVPKANYAQAKLVSEMEIVPVASLEDLIKWKRGQISLKKLIELAKKDCSLKEKKKVKKRYLLEEMKGLAQVKRGLLIAAAGRHHVLMIGSPESNFLQLGQAGADLRFSLSEIQKQEVAAIHEKWSDWLPPVRMPAFNISAASFYGYQRSLSPGEVSLAHHGVLILSNLANYAAAVRGGLSELLFEKKVVLSNSDQRCVFPADFWLIAGIYPCACGYHGSHTHKCICSPDQRKKFFVKYLSSLLPFFDLCLNLTSDLEAVDFFSPKRSALDIKVLLDNAQKMQQQRKKINSNLETSFIKNLLLNNQSLKDCCHDVQSQLNLTQAEIIKIIKVARTIADLSLKEKIESEHIKEALSFRWRNFFK